MSASVIKNALYNGILHGQNLFTKKVMPGEIGSVMAQFFFYPINVER